jgi:hypothetical protein
MLYAAYNNKNSLFISQKPIVLIKTRICDNDRIITNFGSLPNNKEFVMVTYDRTLNTEVVQR